MKQEQREGPALLSSWPLGLCYSENHWPPPGHDHKPGKRFKQDFVSLSHPHLPAPGPHQNVVKEICLMCTRVRVHSKCMVTFPCGFDFSLLQLGLLRRSWVTVVCFSVWRPCPCGLPDLRDRSPTGQLLKGVASFTEGFPTGKLKDVGELFLVSMPHLPCFPGTRASLRQLGHVC